LIAGRGAVFIHRVVGPVHPVEDVKQQAQEHAHDAREHHAFQFHRPDLKADPGKAGDKDDGRHHDIAVPAEIHLGIHQNPQAGSADHPVEQEGDPADHGAGDGADQGGELADERAEDGDDGRAADDPDAVNLRHRHHADIFAVGRRRHGTDQPGNHGGDAVAQQGAVKTGVLQQVVPDDLARDDLVADVLRNDEKRNGQHGDHRIHPESGKLEMRQGDHARLLHLCEIHNADTDRRNVAADDRDQDRDHRKKPAEQDGAEHRNAQGDEKDDHVSGVHPRDDLAVKALGFLGKLIARRRQNSRRRRRRAGKLQADQGDDRAHGRGRKKGFDPVGAEFIDNEREQPDQDADRDKPALRIGESAAGRVFVARHHDQRRADEREAGTQESRRLPLCDPEKEQRAEPVHQQDHGRVDSEQGGNQNGCAEHGEHMLNAQRDRLFQRRPFLHLDNFF